MTLLKTIFATFGSLFKVLKFASILAPFAWVFSKLGGLFSFLPGGSIMGIIGGIFSAIMWMIKWTIADFLDAWKEPQRAVARVLCFAIMLGIGVYCGIKYDGEKAAQVEVRLNKMIADLKKADNADRSKLGEALKAKAAAEAQERTLATAPPVIAAPAPAVPPTAASPTATPPVVAAAPPAKRVRHTKGKDSGQGSGSWMSRFW